MKINRKNYLDKVKACWMGKNIGGTMGMPYEGCRNMVELTGFKSAEMLPNDDLDLQLVWLCAVEENGISKITPALLGEYWLNYVVPHWNEYGICKANMRMGCQPPYSGEFENEKWKNSNGAWIRTELWACLFPGVPELAVKYAFMDACVDHGMGEGTYGAMFVAALESEAFYEKDIRVLIEKALKFIPETSRVAQSVKLAIEMYDKKATLEEARNAIVNDSADLGWFQAPGNIAFVVLGLLYGEGDYKKSMISAISCGDDTDCTGATIGSIMGIMNGMECVPGDWSEFIGDKIVSEAVDVAYRSLPKAVSELTERVYQLVPAVMKDNRIFAEFTDEDVTEKAVFPEVVRKYDHQLPRTGLCMYFPEFTYVRARVEFDKSKIRPGETVTFKIIAKNVLEDQKQLIISTIVPEGWSVDKAETSMFLHRTMRVPATETEITVTAGENISAVNKIRFVLNCPWRHSESYLSVPIFG